jgi:uroporphyrinogen-III synthase
MKFLITRPEPGAAETFEALTEMGHAGVISPLLNYVSTGETPDLKDVQALAATSAEGVRAFARLSRRRNLPIFTVGEATATAARLEKFTDVRSAAGDATALSRLLSNLDPQRGAVVHLAGRDVARKLGVAGLEVRRAVLYAAEATQAFPADVAAALTKGEFHGVLLFSPRTAQIFARLMRSSGIKPGGLIAYCLSPSVAKGLSGLCATRVADRPAQDALLALIP